MEGVFRTIPAFLEQEGMPPEVREAVVIAAWKRVAGDSLSANTAAVGLEETTLKVAVRDTTWKRHLESMSPQLIFRINSALRNAAVTYIEFVVDEGEVRAGSVPALTHPTSARFAVAASNEAGDDLRNAADNIKDPELRELYLGAAANCLARKRLMAK